MAARVPDLPSATFLAGTYEFTRGQAVEMSRLHYRGVSVRQLQAQFHPDATLEQLIVALQVGIVCQGSMNLDELNPAIFDPTIVALCAWNLGDPIDNNE